MEGQAAVPNGRTQPDFKNESNQISTYIADKQPPIGDKITVLIGELDTTLPGMATSGDERPVTPYFPEEIIGLVFERFSVRATVCTGFDDVYVRKVWMLTTKFCHQVGICRH
jgi:hypothetical protein